MRLALALVTATLLSACASAPPPVEVVPHEPTIPDGDAGGWARACVRGPKDMAPPPDGRPYSSLNERQRLVLSLVERLAMTTQTADSAARKSQVDGFVAERGRETLAEMREDRDAIGWRVDAIERRAQRKYGLRTVSPCYGLLIDLFHSLSSAIDFRAQHEERGDVWPPPDGATP